MESRYHYKDLNNLSTSELFIWIAVDQTMSQLGVGDYVAVLAVLAGQPIIPTRAKPLGATKGTSFASAISRRFLHQQMPFRLPTLTNLSLRTLRPVMTNNLGAFVGRTVPVVGWVILAYDVSQIMIKTVSTYNRLVMPEDRL
jgi:hypothetical protein